MQLSHMEREFKNEHRKNVSRETPMLAANRLTQISNERISAVCRHFFVRCSIIGRLFVACPPSSDSLLVGLLHYGLRPVQQDRLRNCPLQCRQRQQNISLFRAYKAGLSFAKIPNCGGHFCRLSKSWQTKSD